MRASEVVAGLPVPTVRARYRMPVACPIGHDGVLMSTALVAGLLGLFGTVLGAGLTTWTMRQTALLTGIVVHDLRTLAAVETKPA